MKRKTWLVLFALAVAGFGVVARSATFSVFCNGHIEVIVRGCAVKLTGKIEAGDADRLRAIIRRPLPDGWHYHWLLLDSPGGSIAAAIEIADVVRQSLLSTTTSRALDSQKAKGPLSQWRWKCISACFLVWVAGAERSAFRAGDMDDASDIGLHRPYLDKASYSSAPEKVAAIQQPAMQATAEYLKREQVPQSLIQKMLEHASTQIYWLKSEDEDIPALSPWFEEMMISRCDFDPTYERQSQERMNQQFADNWARIHNKQSWRKNDEDAINKRYIEWRQRYNSCERAARSAVQAAMRK